MTIKKLVIWFVLSLVIFIIARIPASFVFERLPFTQYGVIYQNVSGTIWSGKATAIQYDSHLFNQVRWQFEPSKLFTGNLGLSVRFGDARDKHQYSGRATVMTGFAGKQVEDMQFRVLANDLKFLSPIPLSHVDGRVVLEIDNYAFGEPLCNKLSGQLTWLNAGVDIDGDIPFGTLNVGFACENNQIAATIDSNNLLGLEGKGMLLSSTDFSFEGIANPSTELPAVIHQSIAFIGKKRNDGRFDIKL